MQQDSLGLYLSIPFCKAKCSFCNFASGVFAAERMQTYVDRLCEEIREARSTARAFGANLPNRVDTVYFGGGTPSLLESAHLGQIFATLRNEFSVEANAEITLEAAPGQLSVCTLDAAIRVGVNRVSFGVQSFVDAESAAVGRLHTGADCLRELARMRSAGVARLSLDLIAGLPLQTEASLSESIEVAIGSGVDHLSLYMLEVDEDSRLGREALAGGSRYHAATLPAEDATADWYLAACERLNAAGIAQYEISNFARPGFASRHNLKYWYRRPYLGFGLDAHSMLCCPSGEAVRWANTSDMDEYVGTKNGQGGSIFPFASLRATGGAVERIDASKAFEEELFLGLRLTEGVDLAHLLQQFGVERLDLIGAPLHDVEQAGLVQRKLGRIHLTAAGRLASNEVFSRLLAA